VGQHDAMGFTPFAIDELGYSSATGTWADPSDLPIARSYATLAQLAPTILEYQGKGKMAGVVVSADDPPQKVALGDYVLEVSYARSRMPPAPLAPGAAPPPPPAPAGALFISVGPDEYIAAGSGPVSVTFAPSPDKPGPPAAGIVYTEEGSFVNGRWVSGRRLNGDENGQGKFLRLSGGAIHNGLIQRVKLYRYR